MNITGSSCERFPNLETLAATEESNVLAAWSGLGYYRRARMMRLCAQEITRDHGGRFPQTSQELQTLPGIGRYTAAAIASIAFAEPIAVVDGNVERVLATPRGPRPHRERSLDTGPGASERIAPRRFQSGHDGIRRNRLHSAPTEV